MLNEKFTPPYTPNKILSPKLVWNKSKIKIKFEGSCLKQENKAPFIPNNVVNLFIVYELERWSRDLNTDFTLKDCLFGAVKLAINPDPDKYKYSGYGIGFDLRSEFSLLDGRMGKNAIIFGVDMSSYLHIDNRKKDILILVKSSTKRLDDTTLIAEAQYQLIFQDQIENFV